MNAREMASRIVAEGAQYRENGEAELVKRAGEYSIAENSKHAAQNTKAELSKLFGAKGRSQEWDETVRQNAALARIACEAFEEEYESYRRRCAKSA